MCKGLYDVESLGNNYTQFHSMHWKQHSVNPDGIKLVLIIANFLQVEFVFSRLAYK